MRIDPCILRPRFGALLLGAICGVTAPAQDALAAPAWGQDDERPPQEPAPPETPVYRSGHARLGVAVRSTTSFFTDLGGDDSPPGGLWVAGGGTIANLYPFTFIPSFRGHATLGYSGRSFGVGVDLGGGAGWGLMPFSVDAGAALRLGRIDGVHANLLFYWYVYPGSPYPVGGELTLHVPVGARTWLRLEASREIRLLVGWRATVGAEHQVGRTDPRGGKNFLTWGAGVVSLLGDEEFAASTWTFGLHALVELGYERRF